MLVLFSSLTACVCTACSGPCERLTVPTSLETPPVSEATVWAALADFAPAVVRWTTPAADGATESPIDWSLRRASGDARTVLYAASDFCEARTGLAIPVVVDANVDDGSATQSWATDLEGFGATPDQISLFDEGALTDDVHATLSDEWSERCANDGARGEASLDEAWITYNGTFAALRFNIFGGRTTADTHSVPNCGSGVLGEVPGDTADTSDTADTGDGE